MGHHHLALFGEAEKGEYSLPIFCHSTVELFDQLGHPPEDSLGIYFALQALLYEKQLIFFRVKEEGFSTEDYLKSFTYLRKNSKKNLKLTAFCMPGVGNKEIIEAVIPLCHLYQSILVMNEKDFYDFLH